MGYWDRIKNLLGVEEENKSERKIKFSPEELREMNDPTTAVGRLLNPRIPATTDRHLDFLGDKPTLRDVLMRNPITPSYDQFDGMPLLNREDYDRKIQREYLFRDREPQDPGKEFLYHGTGDVFSSIDPYQASNETSEAIADAYRKDAIKRNVISPDDDKITQNNKIVEDIKKTRGLQDTKIKYGSTGSAEAEYDKNKNEITISGEYDPFIGLSWPVYNTRGFLTYPPNRIDPDRFYSGKRLNELTELQKKRLEGNKLDHSLMAQIHELRHAEDAKKSKKEKYPNQHFNDADALSHYDSLDHNGAYLNADAVSGRLHDIRAAALQRLSNMGEEEK
jgi:hypothetical protein